MSLGTTSAPTIISKTAKGPRDVRANIQALRQQGALGIGVADAVDQLQAQLDAIRQPLQEPLPLPDEITIKGPNGRLIAWIGYRVVNGRAYHGGYFDEIYIGPGDPTTAILYSDGQSVQIGKNGWISVLDPYSSIGAWIGTQSEKTQAVTGAANNGSGSIRLTVTAHHYTTGDQVSVAAVGGVPNSTGQWIISVISANTFDLIGSTWAGTYTTGGTVLRYYSGAAYASLAVGGATRITAVADNGTGLIRVTSASHGLQTGWFATVTGVGGVPNANGYFYVTRINADAVDLQGSTFAGTYTSGGSIFAWPNAKFRAQANGDLDITNALITLTGTGTPSSTITLDPTSGSITVKANAPGTLESVLDAAGLIIFNQAGNAPGTVLDGSSLTVAEKITQLTANPPVYAIAGNKTLAVAGELAVEDASNVVVWISQAFGIRLYASGLVKIDMESLTGNIESRSLSINGTQIVDTTRNAHFATVDAGGYKTGGVSGITQAQTIAEGITFTTAPFVTSVTGPGVSTVGTATAVTGATVTLKSLQFNAGLLTADV